MSLYRMGGKRVLDVAGSALLLLLLSPILVVVALVLAVDLRGSPFFIQARPGLGEKIFRIVKFKTMRDALGPEGNPLPDRDRLTRIGRFVRRTSLDELPQFVNILMGDMSFVGPRPLLVKYLPFYSDYERKRHTVRPGITGAAQVSGRNLILWEDRIRLDVTYAENVCLSNDFSIVMRSIGRVLARDGIAEAPAEMGRVTLDVRRDPKNAGLFDENGFRLPSTVEDRDA